MKKVAFLLLIALCLAAHPAVAQQLLLVGSVVDAETEAPVEYASVLLPDYGLWAITNEKGAFTIKDVPKGKALLTVQCLGYQKRSLHVELLRNVDDLVLKLRPNSLKLDEVTVVAKRKEDEATTS